MKNLRAVFGIFWMNLKSVLGVLINNKLRSFITILGIIVGIISVSIIISLTDAMRERIEEKLSSEADSIRVSSLAEVSRYGAKSNNFKSSDLETLKSKIPGIREVINELSSDAGQLPGERNGYIRFSGLLPASIRENAKNMERTEGRLFQKQEYEKGKMVAIITEKLAKKYFKKQSAFGKKIRIKDKYLTVVGVVKPTGGGGYNPFQENYVMIPYKTMENRFTGKTDVQNFTVKVKDVLKADKIKRELTYQLMKMQKVSSIKKLGFEIYDSSRFIKEFRSTSKIMTLVFGSIAAISLFVGGLGVMNIMIVSVSERTREIGIRKSVGALDSDILYQFLLESLVLTLFGGLIGVLISVGMIRVGNLFISAFPMFEGVHVSLSELALLISTIACLIVGLVFGAIPALKAARLKPIDALRSE